MSAMLGNLSCVVVAVDDSEESMNALRWALDNLRLRSPAKANSEAGGSFVVLHVQSPPSIAAGLNPGAIPFGGPSDLEVPAFTAAIEAHQRRITAAILDHALQICSEKNVEVETQVVVGDPKEKICEVVETFHADLLVMGSRDFGPIKRKLVHLKWHLNDIGGEVSCGKPSHSLERPGGCSLHKRGQYAENLFDPGVLLNGDPKMFDEYAGMLAL